MAVVSGLVSSSTHMNEPSTWCCVKWKMGFPPFEEGSNSYGVHRQRMIERSAVITRAVHIGKRLVNLFFKRTCGKYFGVCRP